MASELNDKKVAFLFTEGVEQVELTEPLRAIRDAGAEATLVSLKPGRVQMFNHLDKGDTIDAEVGTGEADAGAFDALVLPGGVANPDALRTDEHAIRFVRGFFEQHKPVGVICHGPWTLVEADVVRGRTLTSWPSLQTDLRNAGAEWVDEQVHVDNGLVSSRKPDDLQAFIAKVIEEIGEGEHEGQTAGRPRAEAMPGSAALD
jgi:deglycase